MIQHCQPLTRNVSKRRFSGRSKFENLGSKGEATLRFLDDISTRMVDRTRLRSWGGMSLPSILHSVFRSWPDWCCAAGCSAAILVAVERGHEGSFYPLSTIMHRPGTANAAFGYRLLLPALAVQLERIKHSLTDHNAFIATQIVAIVVAVVLSGEWGQLFLPRLGRQFGYAGAALMICPTIDYWTFYDIAIVAFWTGSMLLLHRGHVTLFVILLGIGTLNHENTLLLVPCAVAYFWPRMKLGKVVLFALLQIAIWISVRILVIRLAPGATLFDNRVSENLHFWHFYTAQRLFFAWVVLLPWWMLAISGWRNSPYLLKCSALSLPGLFLVTFLFGKFDEARQFAAFIPTCIGLMACGLRHRLSHGKASEWPKTALRTEKVA